MTSNMGIISAGNPNFRVRRMTAPLTLFGKVLAAWYGPRWRRTAPAALGRSGRTIARWAADDKRVPRWAWLQFATDHTSSKWRAIDRRAAEDHARIDEVAMQHKSTVHIAARLVEDRLRRTEFQPPPRRGRPRKRPGDGHQSC